MHITACANNYGTFTAAADVLQRAGATKCYCGCTARSFFRAIRTTSTVLHLRKFRSTAQEPFLVWRFRSSTSQDHWWGIVAGHLYNCSHDIDCNHKRSTLRRRRYVVDGLNLRYLIYLFLFVLYVPISKVTPSSLYQYQDIHYIKHCYLVSCYLAWVIFVGSVCSNISVRSATRPWATLVS